MVSKVDPYKIDKDNKPLSKDQIKRLRSGKEVFAELGVKAPRGRPPVSTPKVPVSIRLDQDVVNHFKGKDPKGWQSRVNKALRKAAKLKTG